MPNDCNFNYKRSEKNLSVIDVYQGVEDFYRENIASFQPIITILNKDLDIPPTIAEDTIKNYLVAIFNGGQNTFLLRPNIFSSSLMYLSAGIYFFIFSFVGKKRKHVNAYDVLFDNCFSIKIDENYKELIQRLALKKIAIFQTFSGGSDKYIDSKNEKEKFKDANAPVLMSVGSGFKNNFCADISKTLCRSIFKRFWCYVRLSRCLEFDFLKLLIRIYKSIAAYSTDIDGVNAKILISFNDNAYGALRYHIYKKNVKSIFVIQNGYRFGGRSNRMGDMYLYSDCYFGFGLRNIEIQKGMVAGKKLGVGSLRLQTAMSIASRSDANDIQYDVIFLEQLSEIDVPAYKIATYKRCVRLLCEFANNNPNYKVAYRARLDRADLHFFGENIKSHVKTIDDMLIKSAVIISSDMKKCSYLEMSRSRVVVFYTSTMGYEALGLGKKVVNLNPDRLEMGLSQSDEIGVVVDLEYEIFENKLNKLLKFKDRNIEQYYSRKKFEFMNTENNIVDSIYNAVEHELSKSS